MEGIANRLRCFAGVLVLALCVFGFACALPAHADLVPGQFDPDASQGNVAGDESADGDDDAVGTDDSGDADDDADDQVVDNTPVDMLRVYNPNSGEHFYTADPDERDHLTSLGWRYEGTGWVAPAKSTTPVYRLYSGTDHHYTTSKKERDELIAVGWSYEGIGWYSDDSKTVALLRVYNPNVDPTAQWGNAGAHHFTTSVDERNHLANVGWNAEGLGWYGLAEGVSTGDWVGALSIADSVDQIIAVEARGTRATVSMHVKTNGVWKEVINTNDGWVGSNGVGPAREGSRYTPVGAMYPTEAFGILSDPGCPMGYLQVDWSHYWCGDSTSSLYNKLVSTRDRTDFDFWESEHLISCGPTYNYCLNMGWNIECRPYGGSAFFMHCSQGKPTAGCVTVPDPVMIQILQTIHRGCVIIIDAPSSLSLY